MSITQLVALGLVIGSNNLSAALTLGALGQRSRRMRIVGVFGLFEFSVPLVGIAIGQTLASSLEEQARWISTAVLLVLGGMSLRSGLRTHRHDDRLAKRATSWGGIVLIAAGLSIDNLVVGFGLGLGERPAIAVASTIAIFSMTFTWIGVSLGNEFRRSRENRAEVVAGLLLIALGVANAVGWL
jgi:putative Mn2+ efflux pump MntP